jgi:polyhydroxyalkanoate synthesis regulator phasin
MMDFDGMTRRFLVGEGKELSVGSYFRALQEGLSKLRPSSQAQAILVENMKNTLKSARKEVVSLQEKVNLLEERVQVLEENKEK